MFTGLIEEKGAVAEIARDAGGATLQVRAPQIAPDIRDGESIAVNGCCLTVARHSGDSVTFDLLQETLARTNLGALAEGAHVNLERALAANARLGGHFVQGHIDCTARITAFDQRGADYRLEIELPRDFAQYVVAKGSIAVNGISLTVSDVAADAFVVWIIPHTREHTNLGTARAGDLVNLEFDVLAKYVERMLARTAEK
jgi:riboflavin synthase